MMESDAETPRLSWSEVAARVALFVALAVLGVLVAAMLPVEGAVRRSVLSTFSAGLLANAIPVRLFERARTADFGLGWEPGSGRDLLTGLGCGAAAAAAVLAAMLAFDWARFEPAPADSAGTSVLTAALLFFGAAGEEMMFHGYAFRLLVRHLGAFATILPVGVLFGLEHMGNQNSNVPGVVNTVIWGVLLGYACYRSGALWLPIGMHFGWNVLLPLAGANLSGFTMRVTGYTLQPHAPILESGGAYGPEGSVLTTAAAIWLFWVVGRVSGKDESSTHDALSDDSE